MGENREENLVLPPRPEEPLPSDCCGSGCNPCVYDIYDRELAAWKEKCREIKNGLVETENIDNNIKDLNDTQASMSKEKFNNFVLESVEKLNEQSSIYRFSLPRNESLAFSVGQHLVLRSKMDGKNIIRFYTIISPQISEGCFEIMIKVYEKGMMSQCIRRWRVGDRIEWSGPFGEFFYKENQYEQISMLAAGTGIAPMLQVIRTVLDNEEDETRLLLIYSCKTPRDILMKERLDEYRLYWNFRVIYCLTQMDELTENNSGYIKYGDVIMKRRVDEELLSKELPKASSSSQVLICGTQSFDETMINIVKSIDYLEENIFKF